MLLSSTQESVVLIDNEKKPEKSVIERFVFQKSSDRTVIQIRIVTKTMIQL